MPVEVMVTPISLPKDSSIKSVKDFSASFLFLSFNPLYQSLSFKYFKALAIASPTVSTVNAAASNAPSHTIAAGLLDIKIEGLDVLPLRIVSAIFLVLIFIAYPSLAFCLPTDSLMFETASSSCSVLFFSSASASFFLTSSNSLPNFLILSSISFGITPPLVSLYLLTWVSVSYPNSELA